MWPSKPEVLIISDSTTDITTIPMANLGFSTTASSQKVSTSDYNIEQQPEMAMATKTGLANTIFHLYMVYWSHIPVSLEC